MSLMIEINALFMFMNFYIQLGPKYFFMAARRNGWSVEVDPFYSLYFY